MRLLPYDHLLIDSPLPLEQAQARLREATGPRRFIKFFRAPHPFEGEVNGTDVRVQRAIIYGNSYLPRIHGRLERHAHGSRLAATMSMSPFTSVFSAIWFASVLFITIFVTPTLSRDGDPMALIPVGMLILGYTMMSLCFWVEAGIARRRLAEILQARTPSR